MPIGHEIHSVGLIGLGAMGSGMARQLLRAGFEVRVWNRSPGPLKHLVETGAIASPSVGALAKACRAVVLMVSDEAACEQLLWSNDGLATQAGPGLVVINTSTVHPDFSRDTAKQLETKKINHLDAPVTGSQAQSDAGELFFLVGGEKSVYERCIPLFEAMGRRHLHLGGHGMGACAKIGNNLMGLFNLLGFCEALSITGKYGLDPSMFVEAVHDSGGRSAMSQAKAPAILNEDWVARFSLSLAAKDVGLAHKLASGVGHDTSVTQLLGDYYDRAASIYGQSDVCALYRHYQPCERRPVTGSEPDASTVSK